MSRRENSMRRLLSIRHNFPVTLLHEHVINGQHLTTMVTSSRQSPGQDMRFVGLNMTSSESGDYNLFSSG